MIKFLIALVLTLAATGIFYLVDFTTLAGAHPRWADQLFLSGAALGTIVALIAIQFSFAARSVVLSLVVIAAYLSASYGKTRFAASFAEDTVAGQMWFFGWHILCIAMIANVISMTYAQLSRARRLGKTPT